MCVSSELVWAQKSKLKREIAPPPPTTITTKEKKYRKVCVPGICNAKVIVRFVYETKKEWKKNKKDFRAVQTKVRNDFRMAVRYREKIQKQKRQTPKETCFGFEIYNVL